MPHRHEERLTLWTVAGLATVGIALLLAALGIIWAIHQTQDLARLRIADLQPEARLLRENLHSQVMPQLENLLRRVADNLRSSHHRNPLAGLDPPAWIDEVYLFDTLPTILIWSRSNDGKWRRNLSSASNPRQRERIRAGVMGRLFPPWLDAQFEKSSPHVRFVYDATGEKPVVIAHRVDRHGLNGLTILGVRLDLDALRKMEIDPRLKEERLAVVQVMPSAVDALQKKVAWSEDLAPLAPFLRLVPTSSFVNLQHRVVWRQTLLFLAASVLVIGALLAVVWAMWRVFKREIALTRMKQDFVADVSHELKTPVALIRLFGESLLAGRVPTEEKRREYYEIITRESDRLTHLINNILDFARIDAGKKRYTLQPEDIAQLVRETYEAYRPQLDHEGFEHQLLIGDDLPPVSCDRDAVAQALINLINNAMKYTDPEDKFLGIDVSRETRRGAHGVLISVSDRGIGIQPEDRNRLFTDFYRASDERVRKQRGAGLGLALVKHIVEGHAGIVDVESRLVKGSTFRIFLPKTSETTITEHENHGENPHR